MNITLQYDKTMQFRYMHLEKDILMIPNAWDVASAKIYEQAGFRAIGTTSAGIAASLGYPDGQKMSKYEMLEVAERIIRSVNVPVTVDIENGFGETTNEIQDMIWKVIEIGASGINIEDAKLDGSNTIYDLSTHIRRIRAVKEAVNLSNIPLVINARTDLYWLSIGTDEDRYLTTLNRAFCYLAAGADCIFIPGVRDKNTIRKFCRDIDYPINFLAGPGIPSVSELEEIGVARISIGSGPIRATLALLQRISNELIQEGTFHSLMEHSINYQMLQELYHLD